MQLTSADILSDDHRLVVRLHSLAYPPSADVLAQVRAMFNSLEARNSGTDPTLVSKPPRGWIDSHANARSPEGTRIEGGYPWYG
jgi:hypothetical protein